MIVIRDMEMPKRCADCCLCIREDMDTMPFCRLTGEDVSLNSCETKRRNDCPLTECDEVEE